VPASSATGITLKATDLAKAFGATQAVGSATLELHAGELHAIVGENGSGKSTTVKMLAGVHRPDRGSIEFEGTGLTLARPRAALQVGIASVFQEVLIAEARSVLDNVWAGTDGLFRSGLSAAERERRARAVLVELLAHPPDLDTPLEALSLSDRQACAVARGLLVQPRLLVLDEATSALDVETSERLFGMLGRMTAAGGTVLFTSHRMDEVLAHADRVTVMRSGETVAVREREQLSSAGLISLMSTGEERSERNQTRRRAQARSDRTTPRLRVRRLRLREDLAPIDFDVHAGELVGLAGLEGHGQDLFLRSLWGGPAAEGEIEILSGDQPVVVSSPAEATRHGVVYVPRDRRAEALFETQSIVDNFAVPTLHQDRRFGFLYGGSTRRRFWHEVERLKTKLDRATNDITTLSGGNQQKVILARWLAAQPKVLLLNDPTRGVDINVKHDLYELLGGLVSEGVAVVMLSTEVDEHLELMDRVVVFREGTIGAQLSHDELTRESLIAAFFGNAGSPHA
jgi:ABC-type sugar transport system ATPase subunit